MKKDNVVQFPGKRTFTEAEHVIDAVREAIFACKKPYSQIALECSVAQSTINNLAIGKTRWPKPKTLFPLLVAVGLEISLIKRRLR